MTQIETRTEVRNANIPLDLKELPQWANVCRKDGKKQPGYINGNEMKWGTRSNWYSFQKVSTLPDIEFILSPESGIVGIDCDGCVIDGVVDPLVQSWLTRSGTYGEISGSGKGLKFFLRASLPGHKKFRNVNVPWKTTDDNHAGIEVHTWQPFAITGNIVPGCPCVIVEAPEVLNEILARFAPPPKTKEKTAPAEKRNEWDFDSWVTRELDIIEQLSDGYLVHCPWASEHSTPGEIARIWTGPPHTFHCFHSHCADRKWRDVRLYFEPHAYDAPARLSLDKLLEDITRKQEIGADEGLSGLLAKIYEAIEKEDATALYDLAEGIALLPEIEQAKLTTTIREGMAKCKGFSIASLNRVIAQAKKTHEAEIRAERMQAAGGSAEYEKTDTGMIYYTETGNPVWISNFVAELTADVTTDDGAEQTRSYDLLATIAGRRLTFSVPAKEFGKTDWVDEHLGGRARITTGQSMKSHLVNAIKYCSAPVEQKQYAHTGWRSIDGTMYFLHGNGAISQVSQAASVKNKDLTHTSFFTDAALQANPHHPKNIISQVSQASQKNTHPHVRLTGSLTDYVFPEEREEAQAAIRASLGILNLASDTITAPLYCGLWRAPLGNADFVIHLSGQSGEGKTALCALIQQHFGAGMGANKLPGSWESTDNSLEMLLFQAKDVVVVIDDFKPRGGKTEQDRLHAKADRIFRQSGNGSARGRLNSNSEQRIERRPRCLVLSTGEDVPRGQSLKARSVMLSMNETITKVGSEASERLKVAQKQASSGIYAQAMAGYIEWLAPRIEGIQAQLPDLVAAEREHLHLEGHARSSTNTANMLLGIRCFLQYACETGAISVEEALAYLTRCKTALVQIASEAGRENMHDRPSEQWRRLLIAAITSKSAHLVTLDGKNPGLEYGWVNTIRDGIVLDGVFSEEETFRGGGSQIGWIDGDDIYLSPTAAYKAAKAIGGATGDDITTLEQTLRKFLLQDGILASTDIDKARKTITVRRRLQSLQLDVLHIKKKVFFPEPPPINSPDSPDLVDSEASKPASDGVLEVSQLHDSEDSESSHVVDSAANQVSENGQHQSGQNGNQNDHALPGDYVELLAQVEHKVKDWTNGVYWAMFGRVLPPDMYMQYMRTLLESSFADQREAGEQEAYRFLDFTKKKDEA